VKMTDGICDGLNEDRVVLALAPRRCGTLMIELREVDNTRVREALNENKRLLARGTKLAESQIGQHATGEIRAANFGHMKNV